MNLDASKRFSATDYLQARPQHVPRLPVTTLHRACLHPLHSRGVFWRQRAALLKDPPLVHPAKFVLSPVDAGQCEPLIQHCKHAYQSIGLLPLPAAAPSPCSPQLVGLLHAGQRAAHARHPALQARIQKRRPGGLARRSRHRAHHPVRLGMSALCQHSSNAACSADQLA